MNEVILHRYDMSPYAEKVRLGLGLKRLAWRSVQIPIVMPKPDLSAYHPHMMLRYHPVTAKLLDPFSHIRAWMERVGAIGHGVRTMECWMATMTVYCMT